MHITTANLDGQSRPTGIRYTVRRSDLDNAIAAIELALEYVGKLGDFDVELSHGYSRSARRHAPHLHSRLNRLPADRGERRGRRPSQATSNS